MKKILKNKKGFTLVELLAVIVVLAIIMVIATQRIGNVIQKNTADSFKSSLAMVTKQAKQAYVMNGTATTLTDITSLVDYDSNQYSISLGSNKTTAVAATTYSATNSYICIVSASSGKFHGMKSAILDSVFGSGNYKLSSNVTTACKKFD